MSSRLGPSTSICIPSAEAVGGCVEEGGIGNVRAKPYDVSYRVLLPKRAECTYLLVPVCVSASYAGYSTLKMESVHMAQGTPAAWLRDSVLKKKVGVRDVPMETLRTRLQE